MKTKLLLVAVVLTLTPVYAATDSAPAKPAAGTVQRHPLKGVVVGVAADKSSLVVKHENIPGLMPAMTMMFKVDAATLKTSKEGQAITGDLSRQGDAWVLENVKVVSEKKS